MADKALVFDLDGTLWDSQPLYAASLAQSSGRSEKELLARLKEGANVVLLADQIGVSRYRFVRHCVLNIGLLQFYPGVRRTLERLDGRPLALVTNLPSSLVRPLLDAANIGESFHALVCDAKKPRPGGLLRALEALGISSPQASYYVGDSTWDAAAARAAGMKFAWASFGYGRDAADADVILTRFAEVLRL